MKKRAGRRILSFVMTVLLLIGMLPVDMLGGIAQVKAAEDTSNWDFLASRDCVDGMIAIDTEGISSADCVITYIGSEDWSLKNSSQTVGDVTLTSFYQAKGASKVSNGIPTTRAFQIELKKNAKLQIYSGNSSSTGACDVLLSDGTEVTTITAYETGVQYGYAQTEELPAGTYYLYCGNKGFLVGGIKAVFTDSTTSGGDADQTVSSNDVYNFCDGSIIPEDTSFNGNSDVSSPDGRLMVKPGTQNGYGYNGNVHGAVLKTGNSIQISVDGNADIAIAGCQYSNTSATVSLSVADIVLETKNTVTQACYHNDNSNVIAFSYRGEAAELVLTFDGGTTYIPSIVITREEQKGEEPQITHIQADISVQDDAGLLGDDTIILTNQADASDTYTITAQGASLVLKANATYEMKTLKNGIQVTADGKETFTTATTDRTVEIVVASTIVSPVVSISDPDKLLTEASFLTLTNIEDNEEVHTLKDQEPVTLTIGAAYLLACTDTKVAAAIAGSKTLTVTGEEKTLTVTVTKADATHHTLEVWDFGAQQLPNTELITYHNQLTEDMINGWFPGVAPGQKGVTIPGDIIILDDNQKEVIIFDAGGKTNHRFRTTNTNLTRYDEKQLTDIYDSSKLYTGYLYSNSGKTDTVNLQVSLEAGDIVTYVVSSNGGSSNLTWRAPSGVEEVQNFPGGGSVAKEITFYAGETGFYTLYSPDEKLVVARVVRERPSQVTVSGMVSAPSDAKLEGAKLVFTNATTKEVTKAPIENSQYQIQLREQYSYNVSLEGADGYIIGEPNTLKLPNEAGNTQFDVDIIAVSKVTVTGSLAELSPEAATALKLDFVSEKVYQPQYTVFPETVTYQAILEQGVTYQVQESGVNDYELKTKELTAVADGTQDLVFVKKPVYEIKVTLEGLTREQASKAVITFENINEEGYEYTFTGTDQIMLRDGQYRVSVALDGYTQKVTSDVKVNGASLSKTIVMVSDTKTSLPYQAELKVGAKQAYQTINEALAAVRLMERLEGQRVTIYVEPGNYEEMLVIDVDNVSLKNDSASPSLELKDQGVHIGDNAVRITSYYGHGYTYYSMGSDCKYDEELLQVNKENGYPSFENPGSGTTSGSYWNATVVVSADGFEADGIIFENSFNQYVSEKAAQDIIVKQGSAKEGSTPRAQMTAGDVTVQQKAYVERAAALAITNNVNAAVFDHCKFIGRQDTLYGGKNTYAEFTECSVYGGTDYIFGGMTAIFNQCDLVFNTSDDKNDVGYITAAQQTEGRGYLMYKCHVTSTVPGVDTASQYPSKPGYFGRPWAAGTSEVVFYQTTVDSTDEHWIEADSSVSKTNGKSLITAAGWDNSLSGESSGMYEYGTIELSGVDNTEARVPWATVLAEAKLKDGTTISLDAFRKSAPILDYYELDLTQGLKVGIVYDGGVEVLEDMAYKAVAGDTISGTVYTGYVAGSNNPKTNGESAAGTVPDSGSVLKLTAQKDGKFRVAIKINSNKTVYCVDEQEPTMKQEYKNESASSEYTVMSYDILAGHTYYFYGNGTKIPVYAVTVDYRDPIDWNQVELPVLGTPTVNGGTIDVPFRAQIGGLYADSLEIKMLLDGNVMDTQSMAGACSEGVLSFAPTASGIYTFKGILKRSGESGKVSNVTEGVEFVLPMAQPVIVNAENLGSGNVRFSWKEVPEAENYRVYRNGEYVGTVDKAVYRFEKLTVGQEYTFGVEAVHGEDISSRANITITITSNGEKNWAYSAFGSGVDTKNNGFSGSLEENNLSVWSTGAKGKLVPASTDGLAFYYTTMDPVTENFTLSADVTVEEWTYSNGQEGFGMMVADAVGENGNSSVFWNNSYMASVTKVEYYWDKAVNAVSDSGTKYTMKLGVGSQEKIGVTQENIAQETTVSEFSSKMTTLETYCPAHNLNEGTYNLVGNYTNQEVEMGDVGLRTTFHFTIQRNNTGYFVSYTDPSGVTTTKKYYHGDEGDELTKIDENNIYVGFFASRNAKIQVENVELTTINPSEDAPAEVRPITAVSPNYSIVSSKISNTEDYQLLYYGNADGILTISGPDGFLAENQKVEANTKIPFDTTLQKGENSFEIRFTPDADYQPSKYEKLSSYETKEFTFTVTCQKHNGDLIYVSPNGEKNAQGTKENPMDIYSAVKFAVPGQKILLMEGTYDMPNTLTIERGINGTEDHNIVMMADPEAASRPVLDFGRKCAGMIMAADYWYFQGFDVTNSANGQKGIQVSGSHNTLDQMMAYKNGNTGIQISRYKSTDERADWPSYNYILNCTSYLNADAGYEDADGFAAKLTIGDGNVFDGCIAAYNADDGWDLFAKVESGPIGKVVIENCVAFKNGYVIGADGSEVNAGNGNGFKMGGSSISGYHTLINSISFANKAKGIDSNSCPDIQVYNSTSYDNESYNVAFYTNDTRNTDFFAQGVLSFKTSNKEPEQFKLKGNQDEEKVYGITNYYFNGAASQNAKKERVTADWFVNLDTDAAIHGGITRKEDGTIQMNGFLELTDLVPEGVGARMSGTASGNWETEERPVLKVLEDAWKLLESLNTASSMEEKLSGVREALEIIECARLEKLTIASESELTILKKVEEKLIELLEVSLQIQAQDSKLEISSISGALLSLPAGKNGILKLTDISLTQEQQNSLITGKKLQGVAFDLTLFSGEKVYSLKAPVWFTMAVPESIDLSQSYVMLHIKDDGTVEELQTVVNQGQISCLTDSFSSFILANVITEDNTTPDNPDTNPDETPDNPDTDPDETPDNPDTDPDKTPDNPDTNPDETPDKEPGNSEDNDSDPDDLNDVNAIPVVTENRKSPATYDNSVLLPSLSDKETEDKTPKNQELGLSSGTAGYNMNGMLWIFAALAASACVAGAVISNRIRRKEKE